MGLHCSVVDPGYTEVITYAPTRWYVAQKRLGADPHSMTSDQSLLGYSPESFALRHVASTG